MPTSRVTLLAAPRAAAASATWFSAAAVQRAAGANVATLSPGSSWSPRSPGSVSTATPWWAFAALTACSRRCGIWAADVTVRAKTATSANSRSLSTSWKKSLPISSLGTWPQMARTGACDFLASYRPLSRWIAPGPDRPHADAEAAGQLRLRADGEGGGFLVADADPLDAVLLPDRLGDGVEGIADDAPDLGDPVVGERSDDGLGDGRHRSNLGTGRPRSRHPSGWDPPLGM